MSTSEFHLFFMFCQGLLGLALFVPYFVLEEIFVAMTRQGPGCILRAGRRLFEPSHSVLLYAWLC
jgi:hypothetical protein